MRSDFRPKVSAHTNAERPQTALEVVVIPSLDLRDEVLWRGSLLEPRLLSKLVVRKGPIAVVT